MAENQTTRASRKRRALLAAGAIVGIGALLILATWNDTIWGDGIFGTGEKSWNVQASFDEGATWGEFVDQEGSGTMRFDLGGLDPGQLMPGKTVHQFVGIRETEGFMDATVVVQAPVVDSSNTLAQALTVRIVDLGPGRPAGIDPPIVAELADYRLSQGVNAIPITVGKGSAAEHWLGFSVTMPLDTNPSGLARTVSVHWEMRAASVEPAS